MHPTTRIGSSNIHINTNGRMMAGGHFSFKVLGCTNSVVLMIRFYIWGSVIRSVAAEVGAFTPVGHTDL